MSDRSMAISMKHLVDGALSNWEQHLLQLQARRDALQNDLNDANSAIAQHIQYKHDLTQQSASFVAAAEKWS